MTIMGCSASVSDVSTASAVSAASDVSAASAVSAVHLPEKRFGKVSILNGDCSIIATGTIVPVGERTQTFGRIRMNPALKIKSHEDGNTYDQAGWIDKYNGQVKRESVYARDPVAAKAYAENCQKMIDDANARTPRAPRTPRPVVAPPVRRTVFGMRQPPPSATLELLTPLPFKFDLPPLPPMITPPRLV
jgi:hypothetical protein